MRVLVVGAGAVGGYYGAVMSECGHDVTFVARGAQLTALRERGLELRVGEERRVLSNIQAVETPPPEMKVDLVLFAVKTYDSHAAIEVLRPVVTASTTVLTLQNGVDSPDLLAAAFGSHAIVVGPTFIATALVEPGVIATAPGPSLLLA